MKILLKVSGLSLIGWFLLGGRVAAAGDGVGGRAIAANPTAMQHHQTAQGRSDSAPPDRGSPDRSQGTGTY